MKRRIFRSGNSMVLSLPPEILHQLQVEDGSEIEISLSEAGNSVVLTPVTSVPVISPDYADRVESFINAYRPALDALSQK